MGSTGHPNTKLWKAVVAARFENPAFAWSFQLFQPKVQLMFEVSSFYQFFGGNYGRLLWQLAMEIQFLLAVSSLFNQKSS
jgi:hypothetical protein